MDVHHAIFVRWLRCEIGVSWATVGHEAYRFGIVAKEPQSFDAAWELGRELCRQAAEVYGEKWTGEKWNSNGDQSLDWPSAHVEEVRALAECWYIA